MPISDCLSGSNMNRVRYFNESTLTSAGRAAAWKSLLVVCQNPSSMGAPPRPFGLAHIRFNLPHLEQPLPESKDKIVDANDEEDEDDVSTEEDDDIKTLPMNMLSVSDAL